MYILKILLHEICVLNYLVTSYLAKVVPISVPLFMHSEVKPIMKSQSNFYYVFNLYWQFTEFHSEIYKDEKISSKKKYNFKKDLTSVCASKRIGIMRYLKLATKMVLWNHTLCFYAFNALTKKLSKKWLTLCFLWLC